MNILALLMTFSIFAINLLLMSMKPEALKNKTKSEVILKQKQTPPQCQLPLATERFSHDFSSSTLRTKVGLLQTAIRTDEYAGPGGSAYGACQWLRINRGTNMYAYGFTPHRHQETQGLVRVAPAATHSVASCDKFSVLCTHGSRQQQSFACRFSGSSDSAEYKLRNISNV